MFFILVRIIFQVYVNFLQGILFAQNTLTKRAQTFRLIVFPRRSKSFIHPSSPRLRRVQNLCAATGVFSLNIVYTT